MPIPILSLEILGTIFSFLQPELRPPIVDDPDYPQRHDTKEESLRQQTLVNVILASKECRYMALPCLYHTVPETSEKLLSTLSRRPDLARMVRAIDLSWSYQTWTIALREAFITALPRITLPLSVELILECALFNGRESLDLQSDSGAAAVLHLALLPRLQTVVLAETRRLLYLLKNFFNDAARGFGYLSELREVRLYYPRPSDVIHIATNKHILLPTLKTLRGSALNMDVTPGLLEELSVEPGWTFPERLGLQHIDLVDTNMNSAGIEDILRRCPELKTLRIVWGGAARRHWEALDFGTIGKALREHAAELEELVLDPHLCPCYQAGEDKRRIGSLIGLTKLRLLGVSEDILLGRIENVERDSLIEGDDGWEYEEEEGYEPITLRQALPSSLEELQLFNLQTHPYTLYQELQTLVREGQLAKFRTAMIYFIPCPGVGQQDEVSASVEPVEPVEPQPQLQSQPQQSVLRKFTRKIVDKAKRKAKSALKHIPLRLH